MVRTGKTKCNLIYIDIILFFLKVVKFLFIGVVVLGSLLSAGMLIWVHSQSNQHSNRHNQHSNQQQIQPSKQQNLDFSPTSAVESTSTSYNPFTETPIWHDIIYRKRLDDWRATYDAMRRDAESAAELRRVKKVRASATKESPRRSLLSLFFVVFVQAELKNAQPVTILEPFLRGALGDAMWRDAIAALDADRIGDDELRASAGKYPRVASQLRVIQLNTRAAALLRERAPNAPADSGRHSHIETTASYLRAMDPDIVVFTELAGVGNETLLKLAQLWHHDTAWIGKARTPFDVGFTCRRCVVEKSQLIGLGRWGRDIVLPRAIYHAAYAVVVRVKGKSGSAGDRLLNLIIAQLDSSDPAQRNSEALAVAQFWNMYKLLLLPLLVFVNDGGLAKSDLPLFKDVILRAMRDRQRSLLSSAEMTAFEAHDAFDSQLHDLCASNRSLAFTVPTMVTAATKERLATSALAVELASTLRTDFAFGNDAIASAMTRCVTHRTPATALLSDHFPFLLDLSFE